jgi:hypothetical protein
LVSLFAYPSFASRKLREHKLLRINFASVMPTAAQLFATRKLTLIASWNLDKLPNLFALEGTNRTLQVSCKVTIVRAANVDTLILL